MQESYFPFISWCLVWKRAYCICNCNYNYSNDLFCYILTVCDVTSYHVMFCYVSSCYGVLCCVTIWYDTLSDITEFICLKVEHHLAYLHYATNISTINFVPCVLPPLHPACLQNAEALTYDVTVLAPVHFEGATTSGETPTLDLPYQLCNFLTKLLILILIW